MLYPPYYIKNNMHCFQFSTAARYEPLFLFGGENIQAYFMPPIRAPTCGVSNCTRTVQPKNIKKRREEILKEG